MNLFSGQGWRQDLENGLVDTAGNGEVGWVERVALVSVHYHVQNRWMAGCCYRAHRAQPGALGWPQAVDGGGWRECIFSKYKLFK